MKSFSINNVQLRPITSRIDGSVTLKFETGEIAGEEVAYLHDNAGALGSLTFISEGYADAPKEIKSEGAKKTDSEMLRSVIYVLWKHKVDTGKTTLDFDSFRHKQMQSIINQYKELLPEQ